MPVRGLVDRWTALPRPLRFVVVGGINTSFGYAAYASLLFVGFHFAWAALLGTVAGVVFNFFTTGRLVFDRAAGVGFGRFVAVYVALYGINVGLLAALVGAGFDPYVAGLVLIAPMAITSYALMRRFVFGSGRGPH